MDEKDLEERLHAVQDRRGYLLPHHGLMATALPGMLEDYDALYRSLALTPRHLSRLEHETVWLAVLIAMNEALGTHHIARFHDAGGEDSALSDITSLAAFCRGASVWRFVDSAWSPHLPGYEARSDYVAAFQRASGDLPRHLAHLSAAAAHACAADWELLRWQLIAAYGDGVDEFQLAEGLSLVMFPGSVPVFAKTAGVWQALIASGAVQASPAFETWARLAGQGGYDEASGVRTPD